jgi:hypothetical protein
VLVKAMRDGVALLTWEVDTFGYAESFDDKVSRYRGLRGGHMVAISTDDSGLLVKAATARAQLEAEVPAPSPSPVPTGAGPTPTSLPAGLGAPPAPATTPAQVFRRFHGTVELDSTRVGRDAGRIAEEVIAHFAGQLGVEVTVTLEIEAKLPSGASEQMRRIVTENARTLKFSSQGFEEE